MDNCPVAQLLRARPLCGGGFRLRSQCPVCNWYAGVVGIAVTLVIMDVANETCACFALAFIVALCQCLASY